MGTVNEHIRDYLEYCKGWKCLDNKTLKAYKIDLRQFCDDFGAVSVKGVTPDDIEAFIAKLHGKYKPKTVKRKIASLKAFFHYLEYKDITEKNPFNKVQVKFRSPVVLPKTIPLHTVELFLKTIYAAVDEAKTPYRYDTAVRNAAVIELLFATGMRISELCSLHVGDVDMVDGTVLIFGKGAKERVLQFGEGPVMDILKRYIDIFSSRMADSGYFFVNRDGSRLSDQSVRHMINKHADAAGISQHITPHMFRHTFATGLLDNGVDIRYIQAMLGHSSINTTEIYTHVSTDRQRQILETKHPRKNLSVG